MKRVFRMLGMATAVLACVVGVSSKASAVPVAAICSSLACGAGSVFITDNGAGDSAAMNGAITWIGSAFGYSFVVNTGQSKPAIGSPANPQMDITFTATSNGDVGDIFLFLTDTDFTGSGPFTLKFQGNSSTNDGIVGGRAWGGSSNTAMQFSGANLFANTGLLPAGTFSTTLGGNFSPTVNPYSLTMAVQINRDSAGTTTGDLNLAIQPVPEPASMTLLGMGLVGLVAERRRRAAARKA